MIGRERYSSFNTDHDATHGNLEISYSSIDENALVYAPRTLTRVVYKFLEFESTVE